MALKSECFFTVMSTNKLTAAVTSKGVVFDSGVGANKEARINWINDVNSFDTLDL
jgi:hypothetical protein